MIIDFNFVPLQKVIITAYGLNYPGMILECRFTGNINHNYLVEYVEEGALKTGTFYQTQISAK